MRAVIFCCGVATNKNASSVPYSVVNFVNWQKRYEKYRISGVMTYVQGRFIHFLEGKTACINNALLATFYDPLYNHFDYCLNVPADVNAFDDWRMLPPSRLRNNRSFEYFMDTYRSSIKPPRDSYQAISTLEEKYRIEILSN